MSRGIAKYCKKIFLCFVIMILFCLCSGMQSYAIEKGNPISTQVAKAELALPSPILKSVIVTKSNAVKLEWSESKGADGYYIYRQYRGEWKKIATIQGKHDYTYKIKSTNISYHWGKKFTFKVQPYAGNKKGHYSNLKQIILRPQTPVLKSGKNISYNTNRISWSCDTNVSGYKIYRRQKSGTKWEYLKTVSSEKTYYDDKKAKLGKSYIYTVKGYWKKGNKVQNGGYKATGYRITTAVKTPSITSVNSSGLNVKIKWSKVEGAQGYRVFRIKKGESKWSKIADVKGNSKFVYIDTTMAQGTQYTYAVRAWRKSAGKVYWSTYEKKGIKTLALGTPSITKMARNQDMSVKISWNKVKNASHYYVYRRKTANDHWELVAKVKTLSYIDKKAAKTNYLYTVRAYNGTKRGGYKAGKKVSDIPKVVSLKKGYGNNGNTVIHWNPVSGAEGYYIYRRSGQGGWSQLDIIEGKRNVTYFDNTAQTGETYQYTVRAFTKSGGVLYLGPYEDGKLRVTVQLEEPVMYSLSYSTESNSLTLEWEKCKDAQGYLIYKKINTEWELIGKTSEYKFEISEIQSRDLYASYTVQAYRNFKDKRIYSSYDTHGLSKKNCLYKDKRILFEGDSIVYGRYDDSDKPAIVNCPQRIGELLGCRIENKAVSGSTLGPVISRERNSIYYRLVNGKVKYAGYDVIVIGIGTNDFYKNVELGSFRDPAGTDSFYGYLKLIVKQIRQQNPEAKIVFVTPIYRGRMAPTSCDVQGYDMKNKLGYTLRQYCRAIKDVSSLDDNMYIYDSEAYNVINKDNYLYAMYDSLHPTRVYYAKLGNSIAEYLTTIL